jgi:CHAD domain-containing protein
MTEDQVARAASLLEDIKWTRESLALWGDSDLDANDFLNEINVAPGPETRELAKAFLRGMRAHSERRLARLQSELEGL